MAHENQLPLFTDTTPNKPADPRFQLVEPIGRHDYGGGDGEPGHEYPFTQEPRKVTVKPGVAIELRGRAQALGDIMEFYNVHNRTGGSRVQRKIDGSDFNERYASAASTVQENAELKRVEYLRRFHEALKYLYPADEMIDAGLIEDNPDKPYATTFQSEINAEFGRKGREYQKRRANMVKRLNGQAAVMGFRLSTTPKK